MRVAYLTTDEVNQEVAKHYAKKVQTNLALVSLQDAPLNGEVDGVIYDLDYLPPARREAILTQLLAGPSALPVAVHSYNLGPEEIKALRRNGVGVFRRLELRLFETFLCALLRARA